MTGTILLLMISILVSKPAVMAIGNFRQSQGCPVKKQTIRVLAARRAATILADKVKRKLRAGAMRPTKNPPEAGSMFRV
ncbi:hypothetical protein, partial [Shinella sp. G-2]|uniref:hypothetical protein n=1 Tax=Shinella sp. G-2 TaxID=3133141 RepID=UPI003D02729F